MTIDFRPARPVNGSLVRFQDEMDHWFDTIFDAPFRGTRTGLIPASTWIPSVDVIETENAFQMDIDLPGMKKEDVKVSVENNILTISGERKSRKTEEKDSYYRNERTFGSFVRSFTLSKVVKSDAIEAKYENGVLHLTLPKVEDVKPKAIEVKVG
ncbi:MAG TPA: Hsp20/alpha crystallin family protein [Bacteroidota bacterium]|nr:Hsp20/alpha crystallin family protein [Bacteroidota bacterium]